MSLFNREDELPSNPTSGNPSRGKSNPAPSDRATYIAAGTQFKGEITGKTELIVDGTVIGRVKLEDNVVVGTNGVVDGEIVAQAVKVGGKVIGNVRGLEVLELLPSGSIEGDVAAPRVVIADGAFFKGQVEMTDSGEATATRGQQKGPGSSPNEKGSGK